MVSDHLLAKEIDGRERMTGAEKGTSGAVIYPEEWNERLAKLVAKNIDTVPLLSSIPSMESVTGL